MLGAAAGTGIGGAIVAAGAAGAWSTGASGTIVFGTMVAFVAVAFVFVGGVRIAARAERVVTEGDEAVAGVGSEAGS